MIMTKSWFCIFQVGGDVIWLQWVEIILTFHLGEYQALELDLMLQELWS